MPADRPEVWTPEELERIFNPLPMRCVYDSKLKDWDVDFIAETTAQQRASLLEQLEAKGFKP